MNETDASYAEGEIYEVVVRGRVAFITIWDHSDLARSVVARLFREICSHVAELASTEVAAMIVDHRQSAPLLGRDTRAAMSEIIATCEAKGKRVAFVVSAGVQYSIMCRISAATFVEREEALRSVIAS